LDARAALPQNCSLRKVNLSPNFRNGPSGLDGTHQRAAIHSLNSSTSVLEADAEVPCAFWHEKKPVLMRKLNVVR
jgi:hypothetical protein